MHPRSHVASALVAGLAIFAIFVPAPRGQAAPATDAGAARGNAAAVKAAEAFLATLDHAARAKVSFAFTNEVQRKKWSNLPTGIYQRNGLRLGDLTPVQRTAAMNLLRAVLSPAGFEKVHGIMEGDQQLPPAGGRIVFGRDEFYLSFLGKPSMTEPWLIQFGGHHLALNITLVGERGVLAPSHTAAQPASFTLEGRTVRPLGEENDRAFALIGALDETQRKQAILGSKFRDLVLGPGLDGKKIVPEGVRVSTFTAAQKEQLLGLVRQWVGIIHDGAAAVKMEEVKAGLNDTWFAWSGPTEPGSAAYFRIQGPSVFIEYAPQNLGGTATQHIHTMYRDPQDDYGRKLRVP